MTFVGLVVLWISLTDILYRYVRPSMQKWLVLSGVALAVIGLWSLIDDVRTARAAVPDGDDPDDGHRHDGHGHDEHGPDEHAGHGHRRSRVGWLLLAPLLVAIVVDPAALGAFAVDRASMTRVPTTGDFDLSEHIAAHSFGGQAVDLNILQLYKAAKAPSDLELLSSTPISTEGFLVTDPGGEVLLAQLVVGCCAGDALPVTLALEGIDTAGLEDNTWLRVTGEVDAAATTAREDDPDLVPMPVLRVDSYERIDQPELPYLYPA